MHIVGAVIVTPSDFPGLMYFWKNNSKKGHSFREGLDSHSRSSPSKKEIEMGSS